MKRYGRLIARHTLETRFSFYQRAFGKRRKILALLLSPFAATRLLVSRRRFIMPYIEIALTEYCSLRCRDCANLMQYYTSPRHYPSDSILHDIEILEVVVGEITMCRLLGGEPFLYPHLAEIVRALIAKPLIKHIQIVTNGTIPLRRDMYDILRNQKVSVQISNYGEKSHHINELITVLSREQISTINRFFDKWEDYGDLTDKKLSEIEVEHSYNNCLTAQCKTLLKGRLYSCPRSAHMDNLGLLSGEADSLAIDGTLSRQMLMDFYNIKFVTACRYCVPADNRREIPSAVQAEKPVNQEHLAP